MRAFASVAFALAAVVSCGGSSRPPFHTAINGGTPLGQLTATDAQQLCFDTWAFFRANDDDVCGENGVRAAEFSCSPDSSDADLQQACSMTRDACQRELATQDVLGTRCGTPPSSCTATVAQLGTCLGDAATEIDEAVARIPTCEQLTRQDLSSSIVTSVNLPAPSSCAVVQQEACREYLRLSP